jgi:KipI family sensor histidine kinase inhibitor
MIYDRPRFSLLAGEVLHIEVGDEISLRCSAIVHRLFTALSKMEGVDEVTPAYASLAARVDPTSAKVASVIRAAEKAWAARAADEAKGRLIKVPVCYEEGFAPDLEWVAKNAGLKADEVVTLHSSKEYTCMMLGFAPGFVYLDEVDPKIRADRLETPRTKVQAGSVGIAGAQTGIYGLETPGGWRLIGRTPLTMFNAHASPPSPVGPGDRVKFERISAEEFKFVKKASAASPSFAAGDPVLEVRQPGLFTTVQDMGRPGYRHLGVPSSGGLDILSQLQSNYVLGNPGSSPVLEVMGGFFSAKALADVVVAVTGGDCELTVGGRNAETYSPLLLREGDELALGKTGGLLNYLSVAGKLAIESVMGSCSTYSKGGFGGYSGRALKAGDMLGVEGLSDHVLMRSVPASGRTLLGGDPIRAVRGSLHDSEPTTGDAFFGSEFSVSEVSDRTGYRLKRSERTPGARGQVLTYPTYPGYVQIPPDGSPIVLQQDCPTTGGYQLAAAVLPSDMGRFSQLKPGSKVRFEEVDPDAAAKDFVKFSKLLQRYEEGGTGL